MMLPAPRISPTIYTVRGQLLRFYAVARLLTEPPICDHDGHTSIARL